MTVSLTPEDDRLRNHVRSAFDRAKKRHDPFRRQAEGRYRIYRSYQEMRRSYASGPRDRDLVIDSAKRTWGSELFIPYAFMVVETTLPRMLSGSPQINVTPSDPDSEANVDSVKLTLQRQSDQIGYDLRLQDVAKSGLIYGLGVQKCYWKTEYAQRRRLEPPTIPRSDDDDWVPTKGTKELIFDDPWAEHVDVFDFFWDPLAWDVESAEFVIHRTWRSTNYVRRMIEQGTWKISDDYNLDDVLRGGPVNSRDESWLARDQASGNTAQRSDGGRTHEIWEYHDRAQVVTILNGEVPVQSGENPYWHGELPFQIYRPTVVMNEFVGIGEIEPIEHLQMEMNTLRSQRRDNATLKLQQTFAYWDGLVDPENLKFGPGLAIPVAGDPKDLLFPINVGDIPNSGYQEERLLREDIFRTTGIDDQMAGINQQPVSQTATGAQLVQAAANVRIQQKVKLLEQQVVQPTARQWLRLDQQKIRKIRMVSGPPTAEDGPEKRWSWYPVGPAELAGEFALEPEGGASQPENTPQMRQDAQALEQLSQNPMLDPEAMMLEVLKLYGLKNPQRYIKPPAPPQQQGIPPEAIDLIKKGLQSHPHIDSKQAIQLVDGAVQAAQQHVQEQQQQQQQQGGGTPQQQSAPPQQQGAPPQQGQPQPPAQDQGGQQDAGGGGQNGSAASPAAMTPSG